MGGRGDHQCVGPFPTRLVGNQRHESVTFAVVDSVGTDLGSLTPRQAGSVTCTEGRRVLRGLDLLPSDWAALNPYDDRVVPTYTIDGVGTTLGIFTPVSGVAVQFDGIEQPTQIPAGFQGTVDLQDQSAFLDITMPNPYGVNVGTLATTAIEALLEAAGFPNHDVAYLPTPVGEPAVYDGTFLDAIDSLSEAAGGYPLYFTAAGIPTVEAAPDPASMVADWTYNVGDGQVVGRPTYPFDTFAPNKWVALGGTDTAALVGTYELAAGVPGWQGQRGFEVINRFDARSVTTQAGLDLAAQTAAVLDFQDANGLQFDSVATPGHGAFDVISNMDRLWLETSWSLDMKAGSTSSHKCGAVLVP